MQAENLLHYFHHQEWLGSTTMNRHGVAASDFATVSGCDQLVVGPTHARGGTFNLLRTACSWPDLVRVAVVAPIVNSDHSSQSAVVSMAQAVPSLCVSRKVFLKHQVNWNTVHSTIPDLPWRNIWRLLAILLRFWTDICPCWLDVMYQPKLSLSVTRICHGLMINAGMLLATSGRLVFGGPVIALGLTGKSSSAVKWVLMKPTWRLSVSLVTKTGLFLWMSTPYISGDALLSLWCSARVRHCLRLLVSVVDWRVSRLVKLSAVGPFWHQTVQGGCWFAAHLSSVS